MMTSKPNRTDSNLIAWLSRMLSVSIAFVSIAGTNIELVAVGESIMQDADRAGTISGRVTLSSANMKGKTRVQLISTETSESTAVVADATGSFMFTELRPGRYWLRAEAAGFLTTYFGQRVAADPARSIVLEPRQALTGADIVAIPLGIITGRVVNAAGEPVENASIGTDSADVTNAKTNDLGEFRIPRVRPGTYRVWAIPPHRFSYPDPADEPYEVTYVSEPIIVIIGETSVGDIVLATGRAATVSGRVLTSTGRVASGAQLSLKFEQAGFRGALTSTRGLTHASESGDFVFPSVPAGRYRVYARWHDEVGWVDLVVSSASFEGLSMVTMPGRAIVGTLEFEASARLTCQSPSIVAVPVAQVNQGEVLARVETDGTFRLSNLFGTQKLQVRCAGSMFSEIIRVLVNRKELKDATIDVATHGQNTTVQVVARSPSTRVNGTVVDSSGRPGAGLVIVASADPERWNRGDRYVWTTWIDRGQFALVDGLPAGRYFAFHEPPRAPAEVHSPDYLRLVRGRAQFFTVPEVGAATISLRCQ